MIKKLDTRGLVTIALLIAAEVILSRFLSIQTPIVRIGFGFLPIAIAAMLYGPIYAGIAAAVGDIIGVALFPIGAYFPGFTLTAFLTGAVYGIFLHEQPKSLLRISAAVAIIAVVFDLGLNTLWLHMIMDQAYVALLPARVFKAVVIIPVQILLIRMLANDRILVMGGRL